MVTITIPRVPVSPNSTWKDIAGYRVRVQGLLQMHWTKRKRYVDGWTLEIAAALRELGMHQVRRCRQRAHVEIVQYRPRLIDWDNLSASCKPCIDGLRKCGLIYQDSPKWIDLDIRQELSREPRTEIRVRSI